MATPTLSPCALCGHIPCRCQAQFPPIGSTPYMQYHPYAMMPPPSVSTVAIPQQVHPATPSTGESTQPLTWEEKKKKLQEQHSTPCHRWNTSVCTKGASCQFLHDYSNTDNAHIAMMMDYIIGQLAYMRTTVNNIDSTISEDSQTRSRHERRSRSLDRQVRGRSPSRDKSRNRDERGRGGYRGRYQRGKGGHDDSKKNGEQSGSGGQK